MAAADVDVLRRIRSHLDSFEAAIDHARGAMAAHARSGPSTAQHDDLMRELRSMRSALESLAPGSTSPSLEGLRSELRRTTDAYAALARESRSKATASAAREKELLAELSRLRAASSTSAALRREHSDVLAGSKSLREQVEAAKAANNALRARLEERTRSHERDAGLISTLNDRVHELMQEVANATAAAAGGVAAAARADSLAAALSDAQARIVTLEKERDALLDYAHETGTELEQAKGQAGDAAAAASALAAAHTQMHVHKRVVTELRAQATALTTERDAAVQARDTAIAERDAAKMSCARLVETEAVQTELLHTITSLTAELNACKRSATDATQRADAANSEAAVATRRAARAERAVDAYMSVERAFVRVAGVKFFGKDGLQGALGVEHNTPSRTHASLSDAYAAHVRAFIDADADAPAAPPPAIQAVLDSFTATATRETIQRHESAMQQVKQDAAARLTAISEERDALAKEREESRALSATLESIETAMRALSPAVHNVGSPSSAAPREEDAILGVWPAMPALTRVLPSTAAAISALADRARGAHRRLRVCESEREDMKHEVVALRSRLDDAQSHSRSRAHTLTDTLAATREECERAHAHIRSLTDTHAATLERLREALARIARYKERVLRSRDALAKAAEVTQKLHSDVDAHVHAREAAQGEAASSRAALEDLKRLHTHALALCAHKDAEILRLSVAARTHTAVQGVATPPPTATQRAGNTHRPVAAKAVATGPTMSASDAASSPGAGSPAPDAAPPARSRTRSSGPKRAAPSAPVESAPSMDAPVADVSSATSGSVSISGDGRLGPYPATDALQQHVRALLNGRTLTDSDSPAEPPVSSSRAPVTVAATTDVEVAPAPAVRASKRSRSRGRSGGATSATTAATETRPRSVDAVTAISQPATAVAVRNPTGKATMRSTHTPTDASPPAPSRPATSAAHTPYDTSTAPRPSEQAWDDTLLSPETTRPRRYQLLTPATVLTSARSPVATPAGVNDSVNASMAVSTPSRAYTPADTPVWKAPASRVSGRVDAGPEALFSYMPPHSRVDTAATTATSSRVAAAAASTITSTSSDGAAQFAAAARVVGRSHQQRRAP